MSKVKFSLPSRLRIKHNVEYEIVWVDSFKDSETVGECRYDDKQIVIKTGQGKIGEFKTLLHEVVHAISHENNIGLTEKQVGFLENEIYRFLRLNKII